MTISIVYIDVYMSAKYKWMHGWLWLSEKTLVLIDGTDEGGEEKM